MGIVKFNFGSNPVMDRHPIQEGVEILLLASRYRNQNDDGPLGSYADINIYISEYIIPFSCSVVITNSN